KAPHHDMVTKPPMSAGAPRETNTSGTNRLSTRTTSLSLSRSGAKRLGEVFFSSRYIHAMWALYRPLATDFQSSPNRHGECGSPSASEYLWWRRWSATHLMTLPSMASEPATAKAMRRGRLARNEPWVKCLWNPTVMPSPLITYKTVAITMSVQDRPHPQARATAATTASSGTNTNAKTV